MKKISLLALVFVSGTALFAQDNDVKTATAKFGMKAGVNLSKLRPSDVPPGTEISTNLKTSFGGGFFANFPLGTSGCMSFQPELLFNGQGSKLTVKQTVLGVTTSNTYEQDLRYLSLPLMLQFKGKSGFYGEVGPQLSFLLDARYDGPDDVSYEDEDSFEKFEVAGSAGVGYVSKMGLGIGARYNHGFSNVLDNESSAGSEDNLRMRHSVIHIGLFYQFGGNN